ncbi:MAG: hypothetical protein LUO97_05180 [Methanomicrobiales archaeon]|nr:hypothetical protein [Methanomicrobiales archaeon]MDD1669177.1 hypothetical protein [Methanomicrobiales archaeon]
MGPYKRIERLIGDYIKEKYRHAVEIGVGENLVAARILRDAGVSIRCTDIRPLPPEPGIPIEPDDIFSPGDGLYAGADLLYAIRPGVEMVPALIALAQRTGADLLVYHLGNEVYGNGGEIIDCGVILHRYYSREKPERED